MLQNILKAIEEKASQEIAKTEQEKEKAFLAMAKNQEAELTGLQEQGRAALKEKAAKEIAEFQQKIALANSFQTQQKKQQIIEQAFVLALNKALQLNDEQFAWLVEKLAKPLTGFSRQSGAKIRAGQRTAALLTKKDGLAGITIDNSLREEVFIFSSPSLEIDARLSQVLVELKEKAGPQLIKLLFR